MPAANRSAIEMLPPADAEYRMRLCDGGTSSATIDAVMVTLTAKSRSNPRLTICGIIAPPTAETSAIAEPETPPKNSDDSTLTWPSPPRRCPTSEEASEINRSEMPPRIMISPAKMKSGIAISVDDAAPEDSSSTATTGGRPSHVAAASAEHTSANATGTPRTNSTANTPNRIATAMLILPR